jgi:hypothetical protein
VYGREIILLLADPIVSSRVLLVLLEHRNFITAQRFLVQLLVANDYGLSLACLIAKIGEAGNRNHSDENSIAWEQV